MRNLVESDEDRLELLMDFRDAMSRGIAAIAENGQLREDAKYWKRQYDELMAHSIKHNDAMMANVLRLALQKGIK